MSERVSISIEGHVAEVMLDRPDKMNALDIEMFEALDAAGRRLQSEKGVRAVVLHGAGDNFCAGIDITTFSEGGPEAVKTLLAPVEGSIANLAQRAGYAWRELSVPVICALRGFTFGGGFQVAAGADLRFAAPDTRFSIMESKWGIIPDMAISTTLRDIVPPDRIKELAWTARVFDADEALGLGIVTGIEDDPLAAARDVAAACAERSPEAIRGVKRLVNEAWNVAEKDALALEARIQMPLLGSPNQREAVLANMQRRKPEFAD
ncbi:MAG: crotonase/enoyl-CoA hydratase family protein [Woeseiaceae bacterium]|nr:crotonase/enoyl-CoA hydratase family protein [Woeseiaceae bacterium]